ncbi:hypothetical protein TNCT_159641 [Trichonephila clavata]|uniref:Antistasin-like domain-containing protein n=1 Tax=Trichonephila clavata TaxID=2740835 RepID=A0A8X6IVJ2_TRICU|nr:hypothetical protein TNCT_159641 [Trichonephila clavata]
MKCLIALLFLEVIIKLIDGHKNHNSKDVVCDPAACVDPCKLNTNPGGCPFCDCGDDDGACAVTCPSPCFFVPNENGGCPLCVCPIIPPETNSNDGACADTCPSPCFLEPVENGCPVCVCPIIPPEPSKE